MAPLPTLVVGAVTAFGVAGNVAAGVTDPPVEVDVDWPGAVEPDDATDDVVAFDEVGAVEGAEPGCVVVVGTTDDAVVLVADDGLLSLLPKAT